MNPPVTKPQTGITPNGSGSAPIELERVRELTKGRQHSQALAAAEALAVAAPASCDVLYLMAVNQRYLNRIAQALATLERLEQQHPRYSRLFQERGHCYTSLRDAPRAIDAFRRAVHINPTLATSWIVLERLYRMTGDVKNAAVAAEHVSTLKHLPPEVVQAGSLFSDGELSRAHSVIRSYLVEAGNHVEAMRLRGRIEHRLNELVEAELQLDAVLRIAPEYRAARLDYVRVLIDRLKYPRAREELGILLMLEPANNEYRSLYATVCAGLGEHDRAIALYGELLAAGAASDAGPESAAAPEPAADAESASAPEPVTALESAKLHLLRAHSLKTVGRQREAIESYQAAAAARPSFGDAYWSLANLKTYRFSQDEVTRMCAEEAAPGIQAVDRYHLCFALGKAFEDRGEYSQSWQYYERGNALERAESRYRPEVTETNTRRQMEVCTAQFFAARTGVGAPDPDPIFIVGLPRSGSTLIEQILASHSQVEGTQELPEVPRIVLELQGRQPDLDDPRYPGVLDRLGPEDFRRLGERYIADTRAYRKDQPNVGRPNMGQPFFIDKMPNNFLHIGLIHLMLPNARIIDARREPLACCFSNLKQLFAGGQEFAYSIEDIARYYRTYLELMRHWDEALPGRILRVRYESVVADLEDNVRRILDFCGLEFEPACVDFHRTRRNVRTASSEQVRLPIFREGLAQWRNYEPWLGPLRDALGEALTQY